MKKHLAVFGLFVRSSLWRVLAILVLMVAIQTALFGFTLSRAFSAGEWGLEAIISDSRISLVFGAAFLLITAQICTVGCSYSAQTGYTLARLRVSQKSVFFCQAAANALFYFLLWVTEIMTVYVFALYFADNVNTAYLSNQTIFLAFYREPFLHGLLPLDQTSTYIRNILLILGLAFTDAAFAFRQREGGFSVEIIVLAVFTCCLFSREADEIASNVFMIILSVSLILTSLYPVFAKEDPNGA